MILAEIENEVLRDRMKAYIESAVEWVRYHNDNGGCLFDGWEKSLRKAIKNGGTGVRCSDLAESPSSRTRR